MLAYPQFNNILEYFYFSKVYLFVCLFIIVFKQSLIFEQLFIEACPIC